MIRSYASTESHGGIHFPVVDVFGTYRRSSQGHCSWHTKLEHVSGMFCKKQALRVARALSEYIQASQATSGVDMKVWTRERVWSKSY